MTDQNTELEAIKARHEACCFTVTKTEWTEREAFNAHTDRATLITLLETERARADKAEAELAKVRETLETIHTEMIAWAPDNSMSPGEYSDAQQIMEWRNQIGDVIA